MAFKWIYRTFRSIIVTAIVLVIAVPLGLFVTLSLPAVQNSIRKTAENKLTEVLGMPVSIGSVNIAPYSRLTLKRVIITDLKGDTAISIQRLGASMNLIDFVFKGEAVMDYGEIIGLNANIYRDSIDTPLNIKPMIDALGKKNGREKKNNFDFRANTVVIRKSEISYNVLSVGADTSKFSPNHVKLLDIRADLRLPKVSDNDITVLIRRLAFVEQSGFNLTSLDGEFHYDNESVSIKGLTIKLPNSEISFSDIYTNLASLKEVNTNVKSAPFDFEIYRDSRIFLPDLSPFVSALSRFDEPVYLSGQFRGDIDNIQINNLDFSMGDDSWLRVDGRIIGLLNGDYSSPLPFSLIDISRLSIGSTGSRLITIAENLSDNPLSSKTRQLLDNLGDINLLGKADATSERGNFSGSIISAPGTADINLEIKEVDRKNHEYLLSSSLIFPDFDGSILGDDVNPILEQINATDTRINASLLLAGKRISGDVDCEINELELNDKSFHNIYAKSLIDNNKYDFVLLSDNDGFKVDLKGGIDLGAEKHYHGEITLDELDYTLLSPSDTDKKGVLSGNLTADIDLSGNEDINGFIDISNLKINDDAYKAAYLKGIDIKSINLTAVTENDHKALNLKSDVIDGELNGRFTFSSLVREGKRIFASIFPAIDEGANIGSPEKLMGNISDSDSLRLYLNIKTTDPIGDSYSLPLAVIYPVEITGNLNSEKGEANVRLSAPYLQQKGKLLENTDINLSIEDINTYTRAFLTASTVFPTKKGPMDINLDSYATDNSLDTKLLWKVNRDRDFSGNIELNTLFDRKESNSPLETQLRFNQSSLVFNDTIWNISPSNIYIKGNDININNLRIGRENQYILIDGSVSSNESDSIRISLQDVNLGYIFETLDIETAMFGGIATGEFYASSILTKDPVFYTPELRVKNLSYNYSLLGDTYIQSHWNPARKAVKIDAEINQPNGHKSLIDGEIMPFSDSLDFHFDADKIEVGFMLPYMQAFTSEVSGYASGKARLWGSFKYIDMVGTIFAEDVKLKIDFTNTSYIATDTVVLTPGHIELDNITLRDIDGKTALLNGYIDHEFFKKPRFEFNITDAKDLLVYDVQENIETRWFGKIYGNGSANITGSPGIVNIGVNMSTAPNSTFTFVLSDAEEAYDYTFITFRDRDRDKKDSINALNSPPPIIRELKEKIANSENQGEGSIYSMNIAIDVNPSALVNIVMDPIGGDKIKAYGNGNLRLTYDSSNENLRMFGTYTLTRGSYNFTLQDIIIKDFTIRNGSSITFHGDPYAAVLDIEAVYSVNANLSDLDESFLEDKELNRTNVPVHALLQVSGDIRQPDISFDLEFPTLTQDTYRKVRSIVSTEEMMNRQIIYLLALSRFYTPDYMTTTKGNEFVSVASSTISSQLSSMLGQLSENWSISPNFRSDRGDFSDVEVDLALSSNLLNNRLLLNGNFGYRDKTLNNNTFIGDFDIEYLLNRTGSVRLKAYNRYNDRNYYLKSALTTQGVGVVFKRDFDNIFSFLRRKSNKTSGYDIHQLSDSTSDGPTIIFKPEVIDGDSIPADTIINRGRFEVNFDDL